MNEITLNGCTPTPLANYLKALGVLRLLSSRYSDTRAYWRGDRFILQTSLDRAGIESFFLNDYQPTPIMAPWNGGSGFFYQERKSKEKDPLTGKKIKLGVRDQPTSATKTVDAVIDSTSKRLEDYRSALQLCRNIIEQLKLAEAPDNGKPKDDLVLLLRGRLPEYCLEWLDAALLITAEKSQFPPLLGTGGNDGNMDFSSNFMQRLGEVLSFDNEPASKESLNWLKISLFSEPAPGLVKKNIGQFSPGQAGGSNASNGFDADAVINPWDFVLMIEGTLLFAAAAVRRNADDPLGVLSYPFAVRTVGAGSGSLGEGDYTNERSRGELWMPLWSQPATYPEIRSLIAEGRVALGKKPAKDALDFVRAVNHLGAYRGIESFQRFGFLKRFGKNHLAVPLTRVEVSNNLKSGWLDDLDQHDDWLSTFRRFAQGENVANRFLVIRKRLEDMLFELSGKSPSSDEAQSLLILLGEIQKAMATSQKAMESLRPIPLLSEKWVQHADDGSSAFRIAKALAGLYGEKDIPLPLKAQLFPVHPRFNQWISPEAGIHFRIYTTQKGSLPEILYALLSRRLWLAEQFGMQDKPLHSPAGVTLDDINAFLRGGSMDDRISKLLTGLSLCRIPKDTVQKAGNGITPAAFALLKLSLIPDQALCNLDLLGDKDHLPVPAGMLSQLIAGNHDNVAVKTAWRRLRASGIKTDITSDSLPELGAVNPRRVAAALLIPLRFGALGTLARSVLKISNPEVKTA